MSGTSPAHSNVDRHKIVASTPAERSKNVGVSFFFIRSGLGRLLSVALAGNKI